MDSHKNVGIKLDTYDREISFIKKAVANIIYSNATLESMVTDINTKITYLENKITTIEDNITNINNKLSASGLTISTKAASSIPVDKNKG